MDTTNPYAPPTVQNGVDRTRPLGSLAQSARGKELSQAKGILIAVGLMTLAFNGFMIYNVPNEVAEVARTNNVQPGQLEGFTRFVSGFAYAIYGGAAALGFVFIGLGMFVKKYPVPLTILGLVLYIGSALGFALLNPMSLAQGAIIKIFIVIGLIRAVRAALAYRAETRAAQAAGLVA